CARLRSSSASTCADRSSGTPPRTGTSGDRSATSPGSAPTPPTSSRRPRKRSRNLTTRVCRVQPDVRAVHRAFDYALPDELAHDAHTGTIVLVPLHGLRVRGRVLAAVVADSGGEGSPFRD